MSENTQIKPYQFDRDDEVLGLLHRVFNPWAGDDDYFLWKYHQFQVEDCSFPRGWVIEQKGKIVAFNGYLPRKIKVGNRTIWGLQSFDTVTDPDCRGQGLFGQLQKQIYDQMQSAGIGWVYGWTSEIGFKVFTEKMDWTIWDSQRFLLRALDSNWFLKGKIKSDFIAKVAGLGMDTIFRASKKTDAWNGEVREESGFPEDTTRLCKTWEKHFKVVTLRDQQYLNWRLKNPLTRQRLLCAYENNKLVAYLVYSAEGEDETDILDCVWESEPALLALLNTVEESALKEDRKVIRFRVSDDRKNSILFKKAGYFWSRTTFPMLGLYLGNEEEVKSLLWNETKSVYWSLFDRNE